ncbi:hypothetical protein JI75_02555 [Berryella intestinalis]|uniref:Phage portal protein n=1 Tax=Berryella intestinalis TaxID=1531429 RepID=A0A0A8B2J4_9ACTN|nr:phage portal protein [Berryella intestinalis]AJC11716.1 hypothetical protein JI75_02555 [Berryella intestinalis]
MGIVRTLYDWLGNRLDDGETGDIIAIQATAAATHMVAFKVAVGYVSAAISKADFRVYRDGRLSEGDEWSYLWTVAPNDNETANKLVSDLVWDMYSKGRGLVVPRGGRLYRAEPDPPTRQNPLGADEYASLRVGSASIPGPVSASDLFVFDLGDPDVRGLVESMGSQYARLVSAASDSFVSDASRRYKMKIETAQGGTEEERRKYEEWAEKNLRAFFEGKNAVLPEFKGRELVEFDKATATRRTSDDFVRLRKDCFEAVANAMKMPTSMLYGNVNNFGQVHQSFLTFAVAPVASMMEHELTAKVFGFDGWRRGDRFSIDLSHVKHVDLLDAAQDAEKLVSSSLMSPDQVMTFLGLDPLNEEWSRRHYMTRNYSLAGEANSEGGEN